MSIKEDINLSSREIDVLDCLLNIQRLEYEKEQMEMERYDLWTPEKIKKFDNLTERMNELTLIQRKLQKILEN